MISLNEQRDLRNNKIPARRNWLCILVATALFLAGGCGGGSDLRRAWGNVSLEGQPIAYGTIEFTPVKGTKGQSAGAVIQHGEYEVPADHGVLAGGSYKVVIVAMKETGATVPGMTDEKGRPLKEFANAIPAQYNSASTLEVTASAERSKNRFDFPLKTSPDGGARVRQ